MKSDKLVDQLELYSNAIVGFTVAQSVGFSFSFGTSADLGCEITRYRILSIGLAAHFVIATLLASWAIRYLYNQTVALSTENTAILRTICSAKVVVCMLFAVIPTGLLLAFGVFGDPTKGRCAKLLKVSAEALMQIVA